MSILFLFSCKGSHSSASATVQIHPSLISVGPPHKDTPLITKNHIENIFERILSEDTLNTAASETGMDVEIVRTSLKISQLPDTDLIKITAHHSDRATAVHIANTMADVFIEKEKNREADP